MMRKTQKGCLIALGSFIVVIFGMLSILDWTFSDQEFRYGSLDYWIFTDSEVRELPLVGAIQTDVLYKREVSDGPKPSILSLRYISQSDPKKILDIYQAHYDKLGYSLAPSDQLGDNYLEYLGKGTIEELVVSVYPDEKSGNIVRIHYIFKI